VLGGCGPAMTRSKISQEDLVKLRSTADERSVEGGRKVLGRLDAPRPSTTATPPADGKNLR
jgi:hypothetical protein